MTKPFELERCELVRDEKAHIANHPFGHNRQGELEVWIECDHKGERFLSQLQVRGELYAVRKEIYSKKCYILRDRDTGRHWFLDKNACGFWLQNASFDGARTFSGEESARLDQWLLQQMKDRT
jgi:hypothetical protein